MAVFLCGWLGLYLSKWDSEVRTTLQSVSEQGTKKPKDKLTHRKEVPRLKIAKVKRSSLCLP